MKIEILAIGTNMPAWVTEGYQTYSKRLPKQYALTLTELALPKRGKHANIAALMEQEGQQMLSHIQTNDWVVALDVMGTPYSTAALSTQITQWQLQGDPIKLLIGGPDGLAPACLQRANQRWSLSALTLPHPLVRIIVAEQMYRAYSLLSGHPYHR
jgi:23S rRNA (pseudouridine1915-N3)-methyltransferase